jgi:hypothetical protein
MTVLTRRKKTDYFGCLKIYGLLRVIPSVNHRSESVVEAVNKTVLLKLDYST